MTEINPIITIPLEDITIILDRTCPRCLRESCVYKENLEVAQRHGNPLQSRIFQVSDNIALCSKYKAQKEYEI